MPIVNRGDCIASSAKATTALLLQLLLLLFTLQRNINRSIHLCEPCCRREHELPNVAATLLAATPPTTTASMHLAELQTAGSAHFGGSAVRKYAMRGGKEYGKECTKYVKMRIMYMINIRTGYTFRPKLTLFTILVDCFDSKYIIQ